MNSKHMNYYRSKGYVCTKDKYVSVKIEDLPRYSKCEVNVKCDICGQIKKSLYINYTKLIDKYSEYRCSECAKLQRKKTFLKKYGVDNPTKLKSISEKISKTYNKKTEEEKQKILLKINDTVLKKYGVKWYLNSDDYKNKVLKTSIDKYGLCDYKSSDVFKNIVRESVFLKYGVYFISQVNKKNFWKKLNKIHTDSGLSCDSSYELDFLIKYYNKYKITKIDPILYDT